ncbi:MAG TPA: GIY-YIG nuclease family protein [Gallionellaceae bacterium]
MTWHCYLLRCADDTLYCGISNDLEKRIAAHNAGEGAKYTRGRAPVQLVYAEACADKSAALKRERQIKRLTRAQKLALAGTG